MSIKSQKSTNIKYEFGTCGENKVGNSLNLGRAKASDTLLQYKGSSNVKLKRVRTDIYCVFLSARRSIST